MADKILTAAIVLLLVVAAGLGVLLYQQRTGTSLLPGSFSPTPPPSSEVQLDLPSEEAETDGKKEFLLRVNEDTQIFGIAEENPYYGEPPATVDLGLGPGQYNGVSFEIWGNVVSVNSNDNMINLSADYARSITTDFTPRGPRISLNDIKEGDRIVANGGYDENGEPDFEDIQVIQVTPSEEEIKRLREKQNL